MHRTENRNTEEREATTEMYDQPDNIKKIIKFLAIPNNFVNLTPKFQVRSELRIYKGFNYKRK